MNYFKDYENRYFFITGKTHDTFCNEAMELINIEEILYRHFKKKGYDRVIFYGNNQKLFFYDEESLELTLEPQNEKVGTRQKKETNSLLMPGPLGRARLIKDDSRRISHTTQKSEKELKQKRLNLGSMDDLGVVNRIDGCMSQEKIQTVVIFTNADDFIRNFDSDAIRSMAAVVDKWGKLSARNKNICVWIFPDRDLVSLMNDLDRSRAWGYFFKSKMFFPNGENRSTNIIVQTPKLDEIRNIVNYERLKEGLIVDFKQIDEILVQLTKYAKANSLGLTSIHKMIGASRHLDLQRMEEICGKKEKMTAIEKLLQLEGMDSLKEHVMKLQSLTKRNKEQSKSESLLLQKQDSKTVLRILPNQNSKKLLTGLHMIIQGNSGTGKTTVAELMGEIFYELGYLETGHTVKVTRDKLVGGYVGETAMKTREKINESMGGVLFIDEAYTLSEGGENDFGKEAIDTIVEAMTAHDGEFSVIAAGYHKKMEKFLKVNEGLDRRFSRKIRLEDYSPETLKKIFFSMIKVRSYTISEELNGLLLHFLTNWFQTRNPEKWGNAGEIKNLIEKMIENASTSEIFSNQLDTKDIPDELRKHLNATTSAFEEAIGKLNQLTGLTSIKEKIETLANTMKYEANNKNHRVNPGHYIFSGNPGTGKTTVARLIGDIFRTLGILDRGHLVEATRFDLIAEYSGQTAIKTMSVLEQAIDGVLFIDEAYMLLENESETYGKEAYDTIMKFMDDNRDRICVIFAGYLREMKQFVDKNPGMKSRISDNNILIFEDYSPEEMLEILQSKAKEEDLTCSEEYLGAAKEVLNNLYRNKDEKFGNAREIRTFIENSKQEMFNRFAKFEKNGGEITDEMMNLLIVEDIPKKYQALVNGQKCGFDEMGYQIFATNLNRLIGLKGVKSKVQKITSQMKHELRKSERKSQVSKQIKPGHYVFTGNPGTGKTTVARYMGDFMRSVGLLKKGHLVETTRQDFVAGYQGQSALKTMEKLREALDGVLFIDEAYTLIQYEGDGYGKEAYDTIMKFMDDNRERICVIFAGYTLQMQQFMKLNPGMQSRVSVNNIIEFEDYTVNEMTEIIKKMSVDMDLILSEAYLSRVEKIFKKWISTKTSSFGNAREVRNLIEASEQELSVRILELEEKGELLTEDDHRTLMQLDIPHTYLSMIQTENKKENHFIPLSQSTILERMNDQIQSDEFHKLISEYEKALLFIHSNCGDGNQSTGSGFIISPDGYAITCEHVVRNYEAVSARVRIKGRPGGDDTMHECEVLKIVPGIDMALIKLKGTNFPYIPILKQEDIINRGEEIALISYPFGDRLDSDYTYTEGAIASSSDQKDEHGTRMMMSIEAKRGSSGGPVISKTRGCVLGLLVGSVTYENEEINFMRPMNYFWELFTK